MLSYFDADLGPSNPGPTTPKLYGKASEAVMISSPPYNKRKLVTAMAVAEEMDGQFVLYSGHTDGTVTKWALNDKGDDTKGATMIWSKMIYPNNPEDASDHCSPHSGMLVQDTLGVAGIAVRWDDKKKRHRVYTWTDAYEGYPSVDFDERGPAQVKCWSGRNSKLLQTYSCDVGCDGTGEAAFPSISTVGFCRLSIEESWVDTMMVGLHCLCPAGLKQGTDYSGFDLDEAAEAGEGNILPFHEYAKNANAMETWRDHYGPIRAMAVVPDKFLLSYSMRPGHGFPDALILWDLTNPGVPLCRHNFWNPARSLSKQNRTRLCGVDGISISGSYVLMGCESGDRIAVVTLEDEHGRPHIKLHGYGKIGNHHPEQGSFHGRMAMCGKHAVMANESVADAWLFDIEGNTKHEKLDRREGNPRLFDESEGEEEESAAGHRWSGRDLAVGKVSFPEWGGNAPKRKRQRGPFGRGPFGPVNLEEEDDGYGEGGPVTLAINGKWLIAGFSNGTISRAPFLPSESFLQNRNTTTSTKEANHLACCSSLPSDEWHLPILESNRDDDDESDGRRNDTCIIQ